MLGQQNHAAGGANGSIMMGMCVCLCLASKKPYKRDFFVPARTDLAVKLLTWRNRIGYPAQPGLIRLSVCLSVCLSVRPSVRTFLQIRY